MQAGISLSQMSSLSGGPGGATLLHELMSFLRRCLSQQPEVRRALYEGMPAVLAADPSAQVRGEAERGLCVVGGEALGLELV